jgi:anaerobic magnesium-protoporphyrin IX monomethyl ester cyclase
MSARYDKVIVLNAPSPPGFMAHKDSMGGFGQLFPEGSTPFPPLDLVYLGSYLIDRGIETEILECLALELGRGALVEHVRQALPSGGARSLLVLRTSAPTLDWDLEIVAEIAQTAPDLDVAVYGSVVPHVVWRIQEEPTVSFVVKGEPDDTILELVQGAELESVLGLVYRDDDGWKTHRPRPMRNELDALPVPKWELLPYKTYALPKSSTRHDRVFLPMLTSRGCPIGCHYCPYPVGQGLEWRRRSPANVVDEMEHLVRDLGVDYILLRDPMFSLNQKRVIAICDEIVARGIQIEWKCETRVDFLKEETLRAMARGGCTGVNFGVESSDVEIQKGVGRAPIQQEQFRQMMATCRELGIDTFAFFIIGLPGDTVTSVLKTVKFAIDMQPTWVQFTAASPFIGTKLRDWAVERGLTPEDKYAYVSSHEVQMGNGNLSAKQVQVLLRFAKFFQRYLLNRGGLLKDHRAPGHARRSATDVAHVTSNVAARTVFAVGKLRLEHGMSTTG